MSTIYEKLSRAGTEFLHTRHPFLCGAMTWVSTPELVAAVSNAGGFGTLAGGNTPPVELVAQCAQTRELTSHNFGVNLVTVSPAYKEHIAALGDMGAKYVIFAGTVPRDEEVVKAKQSGARVLCFAPTVTVARRMVKSGADALILEGAEAGGHIGTVSLNVLIQEILFDDPQVPVFVAGGLATGRMAAHMLLMGAAGVQFGTLFSIAKESPAHPNFRERIMQSRARDAVVTPQISQDLPVVGVRAIRNQGHADFVRLQMDLIQQMEAGVLTREQAQHELEKYWMGSLRRAVREGDVDTGSLMAGQSVGLVRSSLSVTEIMQSLVNDAKKELERVGGMLA